MDRYAAFLRAINLGSRRRVRMEDLRRHVAELGFEQVETFRASGNVVFAADGGAAAAIAERLEEGLAAALGHEVPVFLRSERELRAIAARAPFDAAAVGASAGRPQVALLREKPAAAARRRALAMATTSDRLAMHGRELHWLPHGGMAESELDLDALAALLGPMTVRTMGTIEQMAAKYFD